MLFLDEASKLMHTKQEEHNSECPKDENCDTYRGYEKLRFYINQEVAALPKIVLPNAQIAVAEPRHKVFISYSHQDKNWLELLRRHFKPIANRVLFWDDAQIKPGKEWRREIETAIGESKVAILLISADFFNSDFITQNELPPLLRRATEEGVTVLNVFVKPCLLEEYPEISKYQGINSPRKTLLEMDEAAQELTWVELVRQVRDMLAEK